MELTPQALARTYSHPSYADTWEAVQDYQRTQEYAAEHPDAGRTKVGNALGLPPGRVRGWLNNTVPDAMRGVHTATEHGWVQSEQDSQIHTKLVLLGAHVLAGGAVNANYVPSVTVSSNVTDSELTRLFADLGVAANTTRSSDTTRATEVVPKEDGAVLGRCLVCLGVPQGTTKQNAPLVSSIVGEFPDHLKREFLEVFLRHRAVTYENKQTVRVMVERSAAYLEDLARVVREITDESATADESGVTISAAAVRTLDIQLE